MSQPLGESFTAESPRHQLEILPQAPTIRFARSLAMPIQLQASILISDLESPSGARGVLDGAVVLTGLRAGLTFSRGSGTHKKGEQSVPSEVMLISPGEWFVMAGSHFHAPIAQDSPMQIQFRDSGWTPRLAPPLGVPGGRPFSQGPTSLSCHDRTPTNRHPTNRCKRANKWRASIGDRHR